MLSQVLKSKNKNSLVIDLILIVSREALSTLSLNHLVSYQKVYCSEIDYKIAKWALISFNTFIWAYISK